jgi:hypothetical protein
MILNFNASQANLHFTLSLNLALILSDSRILPRLLVIDSLILIAIIIIIITRLNYFCLDDLKLATISPAQLLPLMLDNLLLIELHGASLQGI